jgi:hypothetical protein
MSIPEGKRLLLRSAYEYCEEKDKSTEFMLEYMQDVAKVDLDTVIEFLQLEEKFEHE